MARFIPPYDPQDNQRPESEKTVYHALEQGLPDPWIVFPNFHFFFRDSQEKRWDNEADFLLFRPGLGILVLEVKGGAISYREGEWYQEERPIQPLEQARHNKYAIQKLLQEKAGHPIPLRYAHCVCFPLLPDTDLNWPPEAQGIVLGRRQLREIDAFATCLLEEAPLPKEIENFAIPPTDTVVEYLSPTLQFQPRLCDRIQCDAPRFLHLTDEQTAILEALQEFPRLRVEGAAGTGKTFLAVRKALDIYRQGGRPLVLCYNEMLAKRIQKMLRSEKAFVPVHAFFDFCRQKAGVTQEEYEQHKDDPRVYSYALLKMLSDALDRNPVTYDCVIVDEGQDFNARMWELTRRLVAPGGHFYIFCDPEQNIFQKDTCLPFDDPPPVTLTRNCRNTRRIIEALGPYHSAAMRPMNETPVGVDVVFREGEDMAKMLEEELTALFTQDRLAQSGVVVLGAHSLGNTSLGKCPKAGPYTLVERPVGQTPGEVSYYTYMKFKGCEASVVILLDVTPSDPRWNRQGLYTAMSRAVHKLIVLQRP
ncbi:MAG: NERD domain-containing protein [Oligosphaeraceae bacterium]